jgi:hypothetical protein
VGWEAEKGFTSTNAKQQITRSYHAGTPPQHHHSRQHL